jgi:hypothetical protein
MPLTSTRWTAVVQKKYLTTASFKALDTAVIAYLANAGTLPRLATEWDVWNQKFVSKGRTYKSSDRYVAGGALDDLAALVSGVRRGSAAAAIPVEMPSSSSPEAWVRGVRLKLYECQKYACNDVGTFPQCIAPTVSPQEFTRIRHPDNIRPVGMPIMSEDRSWRRAPLKLAHAAVRSAKAGECTNYAYYAAHILSEGENHPRIEVVAWEGHGRAKHLFCMVGRIGGTLDKFAIPPVSTWNHDMVIVDCWALTLGWDCIFTKQNYCFKDAMMYPLTVQMDTDIEWNPGLADDTQARLKTSEHKLW